MHVWWLLGWAFLMSGLSGLARAETPLIDHSQPRVAIIIDDLGDQWRAGKRALALPGPLTYAILPHTAYSVRLANRAHDLGKEVMLHLPMQSMEAKALGQGGLRLEMDRERFIQTVREDIAAIPHLIGINNHMGSLLTQHPGHMQWLMEEIKRQGDLFFLDSRTTHLTVAEKVAAETGVPNSRRDVFLDDDPAPEAIAHQFERLITKAKRKGSAIGIGHPYESTMQLLEVLLPTLVARNIQLVPVSALIQSGDTPLLRYAEGEKEDKAHLVLLGDELHAPERVIK